MGRSGQLEGFSLTPHDFYVRKTIIQKKYMEKIAKIDFKWCQAEEETVRNSTVT